MQSNTDKLTVTAVIIFFELKFAGRGEKDKISDRCFFSTKETDFTDQSPLKLFWFVKYKIMTSSD